MKNTQLQFDRTPSASASEFFDFTVATTLDDNGIKAMDYAPMSNVQIINDGTTALRVFTNQKPSGRKVPAGTIYIDESKSITSIRVTNLSGSTAGSYTMQLDNDETQLSVLKDLKNKPQRFFLNN